MTTETTPSRADVLGAAYDKLAAEPTTTAAPEPAVTSTTPPPATATEPTKTEDRVRDEKGRFAPGGKPADAPAGAQKAGDATATAGPAKAEGEATPPPASPSATATEPQEKPPQSWKPLAREKWKDAPPEIRAEAIRREREIQTALQESAEARKNWEHINKLVDGRESNPVQAFTNYVQTVKALESPIPGQVAQTFAAAIKHYGTQRFGPQFVEMLAAALDGQAPVQAQAAPQQPVVDPRVAVREELEAYLDKARQAKIEANLEAFAKDHEFLEDVKDTMADLVEAAGKRGIALSLEDAYNRALMLDPELSKVLEQRKAATAAKAQVTSTAQAKAAASSLRPQPAAAPAAQPTDRRAVLAAKYDEIASR